MDVLKPLRVLDPTNVYRDEEEAYDVCGRPSPAAYLFKDHVGGTGYELGFFGMELLYRNWKIYARDRDAFEFVVCLLREG